MKKVKLQFIIRNNSKRKACFRKRKKSFMKAAMELSTLCGVEVGAVVCSSPRSTELEAWPDINGVQNTLSKLNEESCSTNTVYTQETYLQERIDREKLKLEKQRKENHEMEMTQHMFQFMAGKELTGLDLNELNNLNCLLSRRIVEIGCRLQNLDNQTSSQALPELGSTASATGAEAAAETDAAPAADAAEEEATSTLDGSGDVGDNDQIPYWSNKYFPED